MSKYAAISEDGFPLAFYSDDIHADIPAGMITISDEHWVEFLENPGLRRWDGEAVVVYNPPPVPITHEDVNAERRRRILAGRIINDVHVTGSDEDARNLSNLAMAAQIRMAAGDLTTTTIYRDAGNVDRVLTPPELVALWQASAEYVSALYAASWALKALDPIPADFAADTYWPA